jgi:hypothetical protein
LQPRRNNSKINNLFSAAETARLEKKPTTFFNPTFRFRRAADQQGDQIGRIFAQRAIAYLGQFFENYVQK